jgi:hypothetical protein
MALRADGFCSLCLVLLARLIAKLTGHDSDQTSRYCLTTCAVGGFAIGVVRQRSLVSHALCRNCPG